MYTNRRGPKRNSRCWRCTLQVRFCHCDHGASCLHKAITPVTNALSHAHAPYGYGSHFLDNDDLQSRPFLLSLSPMPLLRGYSALSSQISSETSTFSCTGHLSSRVTSSYTCLHSEIRVFDTPQQ